MSCSKSNDNSSNTGIVNINRTIDYTVLVVAGETSSTESSKKKSTNEITGATGAVVEVSVQGRVLSKTTDASGQATFSNLTAGLAAVTVNMANHTTVDYVVNLYSLDSAKYDNSTRRISSTKVVVFPTSGTGMITVSGMVKIQSDIRVTFPSWARNNSPYTQSPDLELAPSGTVLTAIVPSTEFSKYVTMIDGGSLTDVTYEGVTFNGSVDATGNYGISVPSTGMGLSINILPPKIATNLTYSTITYSLVNGTVNVDSATHNYILEDKTVKYVFTASNFSITAYTGRNEITDITYNNPIVTDPAYFGNISYQTK